MASMNYNTQEVEKEIQEFWDRNKIYDKLIARAGAGKAGKAGKKYWFLDGPPYANAIPHVGHIKNTVFKDLIIRMKFMKGFNVLFEPGFDTHGLPIENIVEKKLALNSKKDIEKFGIAKFMRECRDNAAVNKELWMNVYKKLGSLYSLKEPYLTYEDYYIESGWWSFYEMYKKGLVYEGEKPVMWCPHCETSLAGYEITDSYKELKDPGIYVLFRLRNSDESLLVYTTTPWTLPGNTAIAVAKEQDYVTVEVNGRKIILAEKRLEKLSELGFRYNVLKKFKGEKLAGMKYEPLLDVPLQRELAKGKLGKAHEIIASIPLLKERVASKVRAKKKIEGKSEDLFEEFVNVNEGTGFVHSAPGHGKTDYIIGQHYKLACVSPVDDECRFSQESGFSGFVKDADNDIIERLKKEGKLLHKETIVHSYPLCWRCKSPLVFRLSRQLFLRVKKVKDRMLEENEKVNWMPKFAEERFINWVENAEDWNISRQRYWGIPIPLWKCECGNEIAVKSREELEKLSKMKIEDLHAVENVKIECNKCGRKISKFKGVLDVWFDSGIAPWASLGYPYENKEKFESYFPADRISEAQDQVRGWFYSLLFCSTAIFEKPSYKSVSMVGWVIDKNGEKMSKSAGNVVTAENALNILGADMLRYYFCWDVAPYEVQKFNADIAKKEIGKIFNALWNLRNLAETGEAKINDIEEKWIISRLNNLIRKYSEYSEKFELHQAMKEISDFILNELSRRYVQMTRDKDNAAIVSYCLISVLKLLAPVSPFVTEKIWQELREKKIVKEESVHLTDWLEADEKKIDEKLESLFAIALKVIEKGLAERDKAKIGLRWPLNKAVVHSDMDISSLREVIERQLNVKNVEFKKSREGEIIEVELDTATNNELEAEGYAREIARKVQAERKAAGLKKADVISLKIYVDSDAKDMLEKHISFLKERTNSKSVEFTEDKMPENAVKFEIKGRKFGMVFL